MEITLDFTARRVDDFGSEAGLQITVPDVTETTITFHGSNEDDIGRTQEHHIRVMINRVTGVLLRTRHAWTKKTPTRIIENLYLLMPASITNVLGTLLLLRPLRPVALPRDR